MTKRLSPRVVAPEAFFGELAVLYLLGDTLVEATFGVPLVSFNRISASWNAPSSWETLSSSSSTRRSFSLSFWRRLLVSVSSFDTRDAMAIDVSLRARSSCSYGSVGMTARTSSGRSKSGPTEFPSPPPCAICRRVRSLI
ncbi:co-factor for nitrate [Striga asiatica]|uniref:Co-factor for nitrate n=1 Tax=Striga asiatica TaxID=4170 RepID=A0A5A7P257_STRAF|nr:co-factor for nitrate [Striga asiatica]